MIKQHYITCIAPFSDLGTIVACRCGWVAQAQTASNPTEAVEDAWNKHLLDEIRYGNKSS